MSSRETLVKTILMGGTGVGKTSLRFNYMGKAMGGAGKYLDAIGADLSEKKMKIGKENVSFIIWDVAGFTIFEDVRRGYFVGTAGALAVFDIGRPESVLSLETWIKELWATNSGTGVKRNIPIVIIGNKKDLRGQDPLAMSHEECIAKIHELEKIVGVTKGTFTYLETCAIKGENVEEVFKVLQEKVFKFHGLAK